MSDLFVVDNSVVMSWCFKDEANQYADSVLDRLTDATALVPSIWALEVINVLLVAERRKRISEADSVRFTTLLSQLPIIAEYESVELIMKDLLTLARVHNLSSYDASYLDCHHQEQMNPFSKSGWTHPEVVSFDVSVRVTLIQGPCSCCERSE